MPDANNMSADALYRLYLTKRAEDTAWLDHFPISMLGSLSYAISKGIKETECEMSHGRGPETADQLANLTRQRENLIVLFRQLNETVKPGFNPPKESP